MKRKLALLMAFMMAATLLPAQPSFAASKNKVSNVMSLEQNGNTTTDVALAPKLKIEKDDVIPNGKFEIHLGEGAEWHDEMNGKKVLVESGTGFVEHATISIKKETDTIISIETNGSQEAFFIPLFVVFDGAPEGPQKLSVVPKGSTVSSSEPTYATIAGANVKLRVEKKEKFARTGENKVTIILDEVTKGSFDKENEFTLRLPKGFTWKKKVNSNVAEGELKGANNGNAMVEEDDRNITIKASNTNNLDSLYLTAYVNAERDARLGDVDVTVKKGNVTPSSIVIAEYVQDQVIVKAEKVLDVIAGKDVEGLYKAKVTIEENVANALLKGRFVEFTLDKGSLQDGEKMRLKLVSGNNVLAVDRSSSEALESTSGEYTTISTSRSNGNVSGRKWDLKVTASSDKKAKYELEIPFVVTSDFVGDVVLNVKGAGISGEAKNGGVDVVIAKAKAPVTIEVANPLPQVKIGLQKQKAADITIKEVEAGALQDYIPAGDTGSETIVEYVFVGSNRGEYNKIAKDEFKYVGANQGNYSKIEKVTEGKKKTKKRSEYASYYIKSDKKDFGLTFDSAKIAVTDGTLSLNDDASGRESQVTGGLKNAIKIAVDRKSTKASTIKVSDVTATLDRTVPYGDVKLVGQFGVVTARHNDDELTNTTQKFDYFTTVTPVSDDKRITTVFKIGEKMFTEVIGGIKEEKTADVAPFIKDNRTMLPVRYVANAIGAIVNYDPNTRVATFQKNQTVVSINIDKDVMYANGSPIKLDTKPANVEGRIFLPIANIAQAFGLKHGETIIWNQENKTVTILPQDATAEEIMAAKDGKAGDNATTKEEMKEETKTEEKK